MKNSKQIFTKQGRINRLCTHMLKIPTLKRAQNELGLHHLRARLHAFLCISTILQEQRASILGQHNRPFRKLIDGFQNCFRLIIDESFLIILIRQKLTYPPPFTRSQFALNLRTNGPKVYIYWFLYT